VNPFAPLADRDFRLYFTGEVLSSAGSGLHIVALGWYLLDRTGSATSVALVWALGLGSGIVCCRSRARSPTATRAGCSRSRPTSPGWFWSSRWRRSHTRARRRSPPSTCSRFWSGSGLTGAALGGPILVRFGLGTAFAIDACTYALSAAALLALHHRPAPAEGPHESGLAMARAGFAYLRRHPAVAGFGVASVIPWVATISLNVVLVAYVLQVMHLGATAYGLADMTYGVGAMTSGIFAALLVLRLGEWRAMTCAIVALIGCYLALAGAPAGVVVFYAVLFLAGFCSSAFRVMTSAYLFKVVPTR
jgi:Major Facilitator Superfamily